MESERSDGILQEEAVGEYYHQLAELVSEEIAQHPGMTRELERLHDWAQLMLRLAPPFSSTNWERSLREVHHGLDGLAFPRLPTTPPLPPSHFLIPVGDHMDVITGYEAMNIWPDDNIKELELNDGGIITPETSVGKIDIIRNLSQLAQGRSLTAYSRRLVASAIGSLRSFAILCDKDDRRLRKTDAFAGMSHLARIAERFGFTVFDITNPVEREHATYISRSIARSVAGNTEEWRELQRNHKPTKIACISREALVDRFGPNPVVDLR